jgi:hypothetical protein
VRSLTDGEGQRKGGGDGEGATDKPPPTAEEEQQQQQQELRRWHAEQVAAMEHGTLAEATDALLDLTYNEPDQAWLEAYLLSCLLDPDRDEQVRQLAVTCLGHIGRMAGTILDPRVVPTLTGLLGDPLLGGTAEDALGDIRHFAPDAFNAG